MCAGLSEIRVLFRFVTGAGSGGESFLLGAGARFFLYSALCTLREKPAKVEKK